MTPATGAQIRWENFRNFVHVNGLYSSFPSTAVSSVRQQALGLRAEFRRNYRKDAAWQLNYCRWWKPKISGQSLVFECSFRDIVFASRFENVTTGARNERQQQIA
jgi:hypothetical protein